MAEFFKVIVISIVAVIALCMIFAVVVSCLPEHNPLRRVLSALLFRFGATAAVMVVDVPALGVPVLGEVFDLVTVGLLIWYWVSFFKEARDALSPPPPFSWPENDRRP